VIGIAAQQSHHACVCMVHVSSHILDELSVLRTHLSGALALNSLVGRQVHHCACCLAFQVSSELDKGNLTEPPPGWIRPGDAAEGGGDETGSSGGHPQQLQWMPSLHVALGPCNHSSCHICLDRSIFCAVLTCGDG